MNSFKGNAPIFAPLPNPIDIDKEADQKAVLEAPEPVLAQPAYLVDVEESSQQKFQQRQLDGKILHVPEISIEEIRGSANMDSKDPELAEKRMKIKEVSADGKWC